MHRRVGGCGRRSAPLAPVLAKRVRRWLATLATNQGETPVRREPSRYKLGIHIVPGSSIISHIISYPSPWVAQTRHNIDVIGNRWQSVFGFLWSPAVHDCKHGHKGIAHVSSTIVTNCQRSPGSNRLDALGCLDTAQKAFIFLYKHDMDPGLSFGIRRLPCVRQAHPG